MKDLVKKAKSFITFDFPLSNDYIGAQFASTHSNYQKQFPYWSLPATRKKIISNYWFRHVLTHFGSLYGLAACYSLVYRPINLETSTITCIYSMDYVAYSKIMLSPH